MGKALSLEGGGLLWREQTAPFVRVLKVANSRSNQQTQGLISDSDFLISTHCKMLGLGGRGGPLELLREFRVWFDDLEHC